MRELDFFDYYDRFIKASETGRRTLPNGKRLSKGTIENYENTRRLLDRFVKEKQFILRLRIINGNNRRILTSEMNYWKKFYLKFTTFLYRDLGHFDNYVGSNIKNIRTFFMYLRRDLQLNVGDYYKKFHVRKEEIPIVVMLPEQLSFLIYNEAFNQSLSYRLRETKDFFVFGCTVGLRFSDLVGLTMKNIRASGENWYLAVKSRKTGSDSLVKLPEYARLIARRYHRKYQKLLPPFNKSNLNKYLKQLGELAGFSQVLGKERGRQGKSKHLLLGAREYRFCDLMTSHTMRRTAVTTLLSLGVPEPVVRRVTGHGVNSKEFYRYVMFAQQFIDQSTEQAFERLKPSTAFS